MFSSMLPSATMGVGDSFFFLALIECDGRCNNKSIKNGFVARTQPRPFEQPCHIRKHIHASIYGNIDTWNRCRSGHPGCLGEAGPLQHTVLLSRESLGVDLQGCVVIIDEAHNIIETINAVHSRASHCHCARKVLRGGRSSPASFW